MTMQQQRLIRRSLFGVFGLIVAFLLIQEFRGLPFNEWLDHAVKFAEDSGPKGVLIFAATYILATLCLFPCALLTVAAGVMYGLWGIPLVVASATTGAAIAFVIARYLAFDRVDRLLEKRPFTRALKAAIENEGLKFMVLLRVSPLVPFNVNNYLLGVAPVTFRSYILATFIGTLPGTILYIYLGTFGRGQSAQQGIKWLMFAAGLLAILLLGRLAIHRTRVIMSEQAESLARTPTATPTTST